VQRGNYGGLVFPESKILSLDDILIAVSFFFESLMAKAVVAFK
jgi:hypothetical protein